MRAIIVHIVAMCQSLAKEFTHVTRLRFPVTPLGRCSPIILDQKISQVTGRRS